MSTALAEPPVTEAKPAEVVPAPTTPTKVDTSSFLHPTVIQDGEVVVKAPVKKVEAPKQDAPPVKEEVKPPSDQEKNFAALRTQKEEAEKRANELDAQYKKAVQEYEEYKKQPIPKEYEERLTNAEKKALELQNHLRTADLARDPDFQAKYAKGIEAGMKQVGEILLSSGADADEVKRAVREWNEDSLAALSENLTPGQKLRFSAAFQKTVDLDNQRTAELNDSERAWGELHKQRQTQAEMQQKAYLDSLKGDRNSVISELLEQQGELMKDEEVRKQTENLLDRAIGINGDKTPVKEVLKTLAATHVLAHHFKRVEAERTQLKTELEETKAKLAERDTFIAGLSGSTPSPSTTIGEAPKTGVKMSSLLLNPTVRVK